MNTQQIQALISSSSLISVEVFIRDMDNTFPWIFQTCDHDKLSEFDKELRYDMWDLDCYLAEFERSFGPEWTDKDEEQFLNSEGTYRSYSQGEL